MTWEDIYDVGAILKRIAFSETSANPREISYSSYSLEIPYSPRALTLQVQDAVFFNGTQFTIDNIDVTTMWRRKVLVFCSQRNEDRI